MDVQSNRRQRLHDSEVFHILGNDRRRAIVQLLEEHTGRIEVSDIASEIAESEADAGSAPDNLYKSVYVSLQQTHLPQLQEDGVVEYDPDAKVIGPGPNYKAVLAYVNGDSGGPTRTLRFHTGLSILGLVLIALAGVVDVLTEGDLVLISVVLFVLVAGSGIYEQFR